eukprot:TRINITY_DN2874_c0_g2_i4.p2 TRINITY_DN2874_c0_g2~~TRINITY_DN2874_c0_g2_i4.p2  ORF type:complete len:101 (+),score=7.35 TRINITY_DN2874_c0_g2_i4:641-943(+)
MSAVNLMRAVLVQNSTSIRAGTQRVLEFVVAAWYLRVQRRDYVFRNEFRFHDAFEMRFRLQQWFFTLFVGVLCLDLETFFFGVKLVRQTYDLWRCKDGLR